MNLKRLTYLAAIFCMSVSCGEDPYSGDCYIPPASVSYVINMNLPEYFHMQNLGAMMYLEGGNKGVLLIHNYDDRFYALERTCPYASDLSCSQVVADSISLRLRCGTYNGADFDTCCGSTYTYDGRVMEGPSRCGLKQYSVGVSNNTIYLSN